MRLLVVEDDPVLGEVVRRGMHEEGHSVVVIPLTPREFSLLHYLMSRHGDVVTRSDIIDHVWDTHLDPLSNVVDVHIAQLRRKVGNGGGAAIETVRGVGYRFDARSAR